MAYGFIASFFLSSSVQVNTWFGLLLCPWEVSLSSVTSQRADLFLWLHTLWLVIQSQWSKGWMLSESSVPFHSAWPGPLKPGWRLRFSSTWRASGAEWRAMEAPAVHIMTAGGSNPRVSTPSLSLVWNTCPAADNLPASWRGTVKPPTQNVTLQEEWAACFHCTFFRLADWLTSEVTATHCWMWHLVLNLTTSSGGVVWRVQSVSLVKKAYCLSVKWIWFTRNSLRS